MGYDDPKPSDPNMSPGPPPVQPAAAPPAAEATPPSQEEKTLAMLAHLGTLVAGFLVPLILYFVKKDQSKFVAYHALEEVYFQLVMFVLHLVPGIITCGLSVIITVPLALIVSVVYGIKAYNGEWAAIPLCGDWARKSVFG